MDWKLPSTINDVDDVDDDDEGDSWCACVGTVASFLVYKPMIALGKITSVPSSCRPLKCDTKEGLVSRLLP